MSDSFSGNEIRCNVRRETICPLKVEKITELTGDSTGSTEINNARKQHHFNIAVLKIDSFARVAEMLGQHGNVDPIESVCPVRPEARGFVIRQGVIELVSDGIQRISGRQKP